MRSFSLTKTVTQPFLPMSQILPLIAAILIHETFPLILIEFVPNFFKSATSLEVWLFSFKLITYRHSHLTNVGLIVRHSSIISWRALILRAPATRLSYSISLLYLTSFGVLIGKSAGLTLNLSHFTWASLTELHIKLNCQLMGIQIALFLIFLQASPYQECLLVTTLHTLSRERFKPKLKRCGQCLRQLIWECRRKVIVFVFGYLIMKHR